MRKFISIALLAVLGTASAADMPTDEAFDTLVQHASRLSGYAVPNAAVEVRIVSPRWMGARACPSAPERCPVLGLYDDKDVIYVVDKGLTQQAFEHILFHEVVHWLQHHSGKFSLERCTDSVQREREAYIAQNAYIITVQNGTLFTKMPPMNCPEE